MKRKKKTKKQLQSAPVKPASVILMDPVPVQAALVSAVNALTEMRGKMTAMMDMMAKMAVAVTEVRAALSKRSAPSAPSYDDLVRALEKKYAQTNISESLLTLGEQKNYEIPPKADPRICRTYRNGLCDGTCPSCTR